MLYIVATPIGHLEDISLRALEVLRTVDLIAAEDTRHTAKLLSRYEIKARQMPFHAHNEARAVDKVVRVLQEGKSVALVSDAGTPGIADPGFSLVRRCHEAGIEVTMVPGPAAFVMALVLSGLPLHAFTFRGFPPRKAGKRRRFLLEDAESPHTLVFYESPHRIRDLLADALAVYGDRPGALSNDLTKRFERVERGSLASLVEVMANQEPKGEYVLVVGGASGATRRPERDAVADLNADDSDSDDSDSDDSDSDDLDSDGLGAGAAQDGEQD